MSATALPPRVLAVLRDVAQRRGLTVETLLSESRVRAHVAALREAYALLSQFAEPEQIAGWTGRDLSSVHKGLKRAAALHDVRPGLARTRRVVALSLWRGRIEAPVARLTMAEIALDVARLHGVTVGQIRGEDRTAKVCAARNHAAWVMARQTYLTRAQIGRFLGGRDETTVDNCVRRHQALVDRAARSEALAA